jgi:NAD(P)-dependent dehydrogenase (short-subunit alcohol dehydrogenase family)
MTLITTKFVAQSTADEVVKGVDLSGINAIVTGGSTGLGIETARSLARAGAHVTLAVRSLEAGHRAAKEIAQTTNNDVVSVTHLDLADRESIDAFVANWRRPLHLLINNAGICACPLERTREGWEMQLATNHLGHFALTIGLREALLNGAKEKGGARIVLLSSSAHAAAPVDFDDLQFDRREYNPFIAYSQSKCANVLFAVEANRLWANDKIVANAVNPGAIFTGLQRNFPKEMIAGMDQMMKNGMLSMKTPQQGAATTMVAAVSPEFANAGGRYLDDCNEAQTMADDEDGSLEMHRVKQWALSPAAARRLWDDSLALVQKSH